MSRRKLRPDELELWNKVTRQTSKLPKNLRATAAPKIRKSETATPEKQPISTFDLPENLMIRGRAESGPHDLAPSLHRQFEAAPVRMDRKAYGQLKRGKIKPDARIDLHGMTLDRAHAALNRFIFSAHARGHRLVLVITGKGKNRDDGGPIPVRFGVLRHQVPQWLSAPPLASIVLQLSPAHVRHGGEGAYYVYLRRVR